MPSNNKPSPIDLFVASRLREARLARGISLSQLSSAIGLSLTQLSKIEKGKNRIASSHLYSICQFLSIPINSLFPSLSRSNDVKALSTLLLHTHQCSPSIQRAICILTRSLSRSNGGE